MRRIAELGGRRETLQAQGERGCGPYLPRPVTARREIVLSCHEDRPSGIPLFSLWLP